MGLVRIFLALVVVQAHFQSQITLPNNYNAISTRWVLGFHSAYAVLFFYVISGFLITFTLVNNYAGQAGGTGRFYANRFIRIFSLYWPVAGLALVLVPGAAASFANGTALDHLTSLFLVGADWNLDFAHYPDDNWSALIDGLHPAWTLGAEMTFYLAAPMLVRRPRLVLGMFLASLLLRACLVLHFGTHIVERWTYYFAPSTALFFLAGQGICLLAIRFPRLRDRRLGMAAMAAAFLVMLLTRDRGFDIARLWVSIGLFTLALPGFFAATKDKAWMNALGDLSFPVYLVHEIMILLVAPAFFLWFRAHGLADPTHPTPVVLSFLAVVLVAGLVAHRGIETPVAWLMRRGLRTIRGGAGAAREPDALAPRTAPTPSQILVQS